MSGKCGSKNEPVDEFSILGEFADDGTRSGVGVFNLGTGKGSSVLEVIKAFEKACGHQLKYQICERRPGDVAACYANCDKANKELG